MEQPLGRIIIITGLSGSGKSTALNTLEDNGFFCIDNLPVQLLPKFLALWHETNTEVIKLGVVMDLREKDFVRRFQEVFQQIQSHNYDLTVIFLEASVDVLVKRFSETRRRHPLAERETGLIEAIRLERGLMSPVREAANEVIDTSSLNTPKLRDIFSERFARISLGQRMYIELLSFGFKHGVPPQTDILMDVRFLPNPYYLDELRNLDGRDPRIVEYVMSSEEAVQFVRKFSDLLDFVIPLYQREGKSYLAIAIGCTGGQHRSVTIVNELAASLKKKYDRISIRHRDIPA